MPAASKRITFAPAHALRGNTLFDRVIQHFGDAAGADHAVARLDQMLSWASPDPAVAAAVAVLGMLPPPLPAVRLGQALAAVAPHLAETERIAWVDVLEAPLLRAGIATPRGVAAFLGQCAAESAGFHGLEEDLRYSAARLCQVWPNHFPSLEAGEACAMRPEVLANRVYAGRMGNGDEATGDGWRFRGRGLLQLTGRSMYEQFARAVGMSLEQAVAYAATQAGAAESAIWFWTANQLNALADRWSIDLLTRKINGGTDGAPERRRLSEAALQAIGA
jgi:putative chitinase